jgi:hypothetical protein
MRLRRSLTAVVLLASGLLLAPPAGALGERDVGAAADPAPGTYPVVLSGDFTGDGIGDLFFHSPSSAPDVLYDYNHPGDERPLEIHTFSVQGSYRPVVGRFAKQATADDIFWYQPGRGADVIWDFKLCGLGCSGPTYTRMPVTVNGTYTPVAGHFFPGQRDDVLWYGRGSIADSIWDFNATCQTCTPTIAIRPASISGTGYRPVAGNFVGFAGGVDDIFWYNPNGPESLWEFSSPFDYKYRAITVGALNVAGTTYKLAVSDLFHDAWDDIVFVGPGSAQDSVWDFYDGSLYKIAAPEPLNGAYTAVTGVSQDDFEVANDFFVYDPAATAGRYYDIYEENGFLFDRYDLDPVPLTELPVEPVGAAAAASEGRRWVVPMRAPG